MTEPSTCTARRCVEEPSRSPTKEKAHLLVDSFFGRGERARTFDLAVPNRARYQLRHTPIDHETPLRGFSSRGQNGIHFVRLLFPMNPGVERELGNYNSLYPCCTWGLFKLHAYNNKAVSGSVLRARVGYNTLHDSTDGCCAYSTRHCYPQ